MNHDLQHVIGAAAQPPPGFFGGMDSAPYSTAVFTFLAVRANGNLMECLSRDSSLARPLYGVLRNHTLSREQLSALGLAPENAQDAIEHMDSSDFVKIEKQGVMSTTGSFGFWSSAPDLEDMAYRLACIDQLGCLGQIDTHVISAEIIAHQITPGWKLLEGYMPMDIEKADGLFNFGWCNLRNTRAALWILQMLGQLDAIDREACVEGILRFHQGNGEFRTDYRTALGISMNGDADDMYYALESLHILGALDRIPDLVRWKFQPKTTTRETNGKKEYNVLTGKAVVYWACQLRLQDIRGY